MLLAEPVVEGELGLVGVGILLGPIVGRAFGPPALETKVPLGPGEPALLGAAPLFVEVAAGGWVAVVAADAGDVTTAGATGLGGTSAPVVPLLGTAS
jgi:hypothetical protein